MVGLELETNEVFIPSVVQDGKRLVPVTTNLIQRAPRIRPEQERRRHAYDQGKRSRVRRSLNCAAGSCNRITMDRPHGSLTTSDRLDILALGSAEAPGRVMHFGLMIGCRGGT
jgi:hypothetical protein